jgi:hypothetical protein
VAITTRQVFPKITITRVTTRITVIKPMVINNPMTVTMIIINNLMDVNPTKGKGINIRFSLIYPNLFTFNIVNILLPFSAWFASVVLSLNQEMAPQLFALSRIFFIKGQVISQGLFGFSNSPKKGTNNVYPKARVKINISKFVFWED